MLEIAGRRGKAPPRRARWKVARRLASEGAFLVARLMIETAGVAQ
jgi:hypothetical protein